MLKHKKLERFKRVLERLKEQLKNRVISKEFASKIKDQPNQETLIKNYFNRINNEINTLERKIHHDERTKI